MTKTKVLELLELTDEKMLQEFDVLDPFGKKRIKGFLCRQSDHRYGSMVIISVNNDPCLQIIWGTPKQEYPFDKNGNFHWPDISQLEAWDKLDGTNILAYWYKHKNIKHLTFKTRLSPVLADIKYGSFYSMWIEYCKENPWVFDIIYNNQDYNLSFEIFGSRNPITIEYDFPLEVNLLFGIRRSDHAVRPPSQLEIGDDTKLPKRTAILDKKDLTKLYEDLKQTMSEDNKYSLQAEGKVLYAFCNQPSWRQFKCKPDEILQIHWAHIGIPKRELWNTAINAFENGDATLDDFMLLLKEEYTNQQIGKSETRINKTFKEARYHIEMVRRINTIWAIAKEKGFDITKDKAETFRFMSNYFDKKEMKKVGSVILKQAGLI